MSDTPDHGVLALAGPHHLTHPQLGKHHEISSIMSLRVSSSLFYFKGQAAVKEIPVFRYVKAFL